MAQLRNTELERLRGQSALGRVIDDDRSCGECGYNLKGLRIGGMCPECGTPITFNRKRREPMMGESPSGYLTQMTLAMTLMALGGLGWIGFLVVGPLLRIFAGIVVPMHPLIIGALTVVWCGGVGLSLRERPFAKERRLSKGGQPEWGALRIAIAATQVFALGIGISYWMLVHTGGTSIWWSAAFGLSLIPMLVGWALLAVYLSKIAYWAGDDELGTRLHATAWWLGIVGVLSTAVAIRPIAMFGAIAIMAYVFLTILFMLMVWRMATMVRWAEQNASNARERDRRMAAKAKEELERERAKRMESIAAGEGGVTLTDEQERMLEELERKNAEMAAQEAQERDAGERAPSGQQMTIDSAEDVEAFGLEDEDTGRTRP